MQLVYQLTQFGRNLALAEVNKQHPELGVWVFQMEESNVECYGPGAVFGSAGSIGELDMVHVRWN